MQAALIVGIVFFVIYKIIELFVRRKERKLMIEKMSEVPQEMLQSNFQSFNELQKEGIKVNRFSSLRWGAVATGIGLGWLLGFIITMQTVNVELLDDFHYRNFMDVDSIYIATTALCAGIALIVVYLIERNAFKGAK